MTFDNTTHSGFLIRAMEAALPRAADGSRTRDLVLTKDALYRLSYSSQHLSVCHPGLLPAHPAANESG